MMLILGLETSCDETAASLVEDGACVKSNVVGSQVELHSKYGGVVPEIASRRHLELINEVVDQALVQAKATAQDINAVAVAHGPGLVGSLLVGTETAKAYSFAWKVPLIAVNHLEGHLYAAFLNKKVNYDDIFPLLALIVSGGHTELVHWLGHGKYRKLAATRDDAAGEAFDKVGKLLGLGYPGGPAIEKEANKATTSCEFPVARMKDGTRDFSFSGLKTAVLRKVEAEDTPLVPDLAAGLQNAVVQALVERTVQLGEDLQVTRLVVGGGVVCNYALRQALQEESRKRGWQIFSPEPKFCTDNAAMIAAAGYWRLKAGEQAGLDLNADPGLDL